MNIASLLIPKSEIIYFYNTMAVRQGLYILKKSKYSIIPVLTKDGVYVDSISDRDFLWCILNDEVYTYSSQEKMYIHEVLSNKEGIINPMKIDESMDEVLPVIVDQDYVPIVDDRNLFVGIVE